MLFRERCFTYIYEQVGKVSQPNLVNVFSRVENDYAAVNFRSEGIVFTIAPVTACLKLTMEGIGHADWMIREVLTSTSVSHILLAALMQVRCCQVNSQD